MTAFGKRTDGPGGRRTAKRAPAFKATGIMTLSHSQVGYLIDVSATGAKLDGGGALSVGEDIWLKTGNMDILAKVVQRGRKSCGVRFDTPLSDEVVRELTKVPQGAMYARLTLEEKLGAADWLNGLIP